MSGERPVETHELRELGRDFRTIARALRQGSEKGTYFQGAAQAYESAADSLFMLAAVGKASLVVIPLPDDDEQKAVQEGSAADA